MLNRVLKAKDRIQFIIIYASKEITSLPLKMSAAF